MQYIYALCTEVFNSQEDWLLRSPDTEYFYVGRTKNLEKRRVAHKSNVNTGSEYPYHVRIRELAENWDLEELDRFEEDAVSDAEEFYIIKLTAKGHPLLNIKRGDKSKGKAEKLMEDFSRCGVNSAKDYRKIRLENREARVLQRERISLLKALKHIGLDESGEFRVYDLNGQKIQVERYMSKKQVVEMLAPSRLGPLQKLISRVDAFLAAHSA
ncbi:hypothetical protein M0G74_05195 [Microbulbifer sp. CAU 1566]|uniref:hypothetical protein n=1 Tax=Microbulbifer sp. CAU 1566 TaxID=2933269 RepID=UPI0020054C17|nr:hypothetical protein [Microbulbifer sp. CAU 1566]MCK7596667.1 hypothetical protein [Microbulbifer sp. CAU 1566]